MKRSIRSNKFLKEIEEPLENTCKEFGISRKDLEEVLDNFFSTLKSTMEDPRVPTIRITNLGTFKTTISRINFYIRASIKKYKRGDISREDCVTKVTYLWVIRNRLKDEKQSKETFKEWSKEEKKDELDKIKRGSVDEDKS